MRKRDMQFLAALRTAQQFLNAKAAFLGPINTTGARKAFDTSIDTITTLAETQERHRILVTGQRTDEQRLAKQFRRKDLRPIVEIARQKLPDEVDLLSHLKVPPHTTNNTTLAAQGKAIADAVGPFTQTFLDAGLPTDFVAQLRTAAGDLTTAVSNKGTLRAGRRGATDGIGKAVSMARKALRVVDAMVKAQLRAEEPLVTEWRDAVRVIRGGTARLTVVPPTPPVTSVTPATTPPAGAPEEVPQAA
jgi:hypothetical protein